MTWRSEGTPAFRLSSVLDLISPDVWVPEPEEFMKPDDTVCGFGDATFSIDAQRAEDDLERILDIFRTEGGTSFLIDEVTDQQYREMMNGFRTLKVELSCPVPFGEYCDRSGISRTSSFDLVGSIDALFVSDAAPESVFVEGNGRCWRFIADSETDYAEPLLATLERSEPIYYTAGSMLGNENTALLPLAVSYSVTETEGKSETAGDLEKAGREMAESVFGENFDFVRRITDSFGNVTYMYGYGEKTLTCLADGSFEYRTGSADAPDPGYYSSLQTAITFVATHGGWGDDRRSLDYRLCSAQEEGSGRNKVYTFGFAQILGGVRLVSEDGPAITVKVGGGEVSYYRRAVTIATTQFALEQQAVDAANVLAGNCHLISSVLGGSVLAESSDEEFAFVASKFRKATAAYVVREDSLLPAWVITMDGGKDFFFGLYDAVPLGFTRE